VSDAPERTPPPPAGELICGADIIHEAELELAKYGWPDYKVTIPFPEHARKELTALINKHFRVVRR
jgi:hypothetical protein